MPTELIYYVNPDGTPTGETSEKYAAHHANTKLHAAFSVYVFNEKGQFLVTQRAAGKKVWPGVWTNTCCGHPFPDESREDAIARRLQYELGMSAKNVQVVLPTYTYKTPAFNGIIEHEFCPVYVAIAASSPVPNPLEVAQHYWMDWQDFVTATEQDNDTDAARREWMQAVPQKESRSLGIWSWWCKDQLLQLKNHPLIQKYSKTTGLL
jgi:isopentenyl-diphosphate Delta-isomerase